MDFTSIQVSTGTLLAEHQGSLVQLSRLDVLVTTLAALVAFFFGPIRGSTIGTIRIFSCRHSEHCVPFDEDNTRNVRTSYCSCGTIL